ncbi:MAG TPA: L,D-transpeptidase [Solirubrobacteraceae bacterium]
MRRGLWLASALAAFALLAGKAQPASATSAPLIDGVVAPGASALAQLREPGDEVRLSNETTITRIAAAITATPIRVQPRGGARTMTRTRFVSASKTIAIYGVLRARMDDARRKWLQIRVPGRPNGRKGWALSTAFTPMLVVRTQLVVDRGALRATLYRSGHRIWSARVGVGKAGTLTPRGRYFIDRGEGAIFGPVYGPNIFFTTAYSSLPDWPGGGIVGIHGTNQPGLVPGRPSHGCIRLRNGDIKRLARLMPVGTPLLIR